MDKPVTMLDDLYRYNHWANWKVLELCEGLSDKQLDTPRPLGFGTLRNTIFHILAAEEIWLERWKLQPPRPFQLDANGLSIAELGDRLDRVNELRAEWMDSLNEDALQRDCTYQGPNNVSYTNPYKELLVHVANHGVHHRAQALNFLKGFGRTVRGGLDHLFFRFANPSIPQTAEAAEAMRQFGLEFATGHSPSIRWDKRLIQRYCEYGDWATDRLFGLSEKLEDHELNRDFQMGLGSIRKTLFHLFDAENFWVENWLTGESKSEGLPPGLSLDQLRARWHEMRLKRDRFIAQQNEQSASTILSASFGGPAFQVPLAESVLQVCTHGTHHRAQLCNMLRHSIENREMSLPPVDYVVWVRETQG